METVAGLVVEYLLAAVNVLQPRPLHVAVEFVIRHQLLLPRCFQCFWMFHIDSDKKN